MQTTSQFSREATHTPVLSGRSTWRTRKPSIDGRTIDAVENRSKEKQLVDTVVTSTSMNTGIANSGNQECTFPFCFATLHTSWVWYQFEESAFYVGRDHDLSGFDQNMLFPDTGCYPCSTDPIVPSFATVVSMPPPPSSSPLPSPLQSSDVMMTQLDSSSAICEEVSEECDKESRYKVWRCAYDTCFNGNACTFAHSPTELRTQYCTYGLNCNKVEFKGNVWKNKGDSSYICRFLHRHSLNSRKDETVQNLFRRMKKEKGSP